MTTTRRYQWLFWTLLYGLIAFIAVFAMPFLSAYVSNELVSLFGCHRAGFDSKASCPPGNIGAPFIPFTNFIGSVLAPITLVQEFGGFIVGWVVLIVAVGYLAVDKPSNNKKKL